MSPKAQFINDQHHMTVREYYNVNMVKPTACAVIDNCYPELADEWRTSDSPLLYSHWLQCEYGDLVKFVRSLSIQERIDIMIVCCEG